MKSFDIQSSLDDIYARYPEATRQPVIGLTGNFADGDARLCEQYYMSVVRAGGTPVIIPPVADKDVIINTLDKIDGLVLTGGGDINPLWAGEEPSPRLHGINHMRDKAELLTVRLAYNRQIPMLGICRGIQTLVTALDGEVDQDIAESFAAAHGAGRAAAAAGHSLIKHSQDADRSEPTHTVRISRESVLYSLYKTETLAVNSIHHQAVRASGRRFSVSAKAPDGVIEAIESSEFKPFIGVQWHPEWLGESGQVLFRWLVDRARDFYTAKDLHRRMLTLDTHCDTPMFFPQGIHFDQRDPRILVDMHKMAEGHQDAVIMAAYLPQPKLGETFSSKVAFKVDGPLQYADLIFDKIEEIVNANNRYLSIARTPSDLYEDKRKGRRSIMLGIENGLALNHDISNVRYFARRGVVYITLCHNGDNDICDSARGCNTHGGVSRFGEQVIKEMNRCGIMVDLSHAGEKSFYDALSISSKPIVCSHSNCKALCDVPRNLTDDQLRALAKHGGVAHITLYHGFLRNDSQEATVMDAIAHLEHAISVMGIEHVGLGTDFDGDGGIRGLADSSELINFTLHLLRRRYSERDIARIWGGNWLRVMAQVQSK
ncbi:peptidase C26 / membrane dipeptidase family M10 multi-domain protein [Prevotella sp. CAG:255]|jgi:membrane dipeptidase|uniref:membrane dipeptidase n=1 Tax=Prevotella sp. CAG:255 TaxID=1262923 RepID=UPI00033F8C80|nr:membrane dipeptidase [Prevotella sp. CAG:255]CCX69922.1 peptidase C26 / membrane dipeptidase family M10 multi-domain protein [Prevotella sp. CAG:255]